VSKFLAINITKLGTDDFDSISQVLDDPEGIVMKGNQAIVLIADNADAKTTALALGMLEMNLEDDGVQELFANADIPAGGGTRSGDISSS
jgi:hypothetical protein